MARRPGSENPPSEEPAARVFFLNSLNPANFVEKLSAFTSTPFAAGETLLFLDEIQACPQALSSLRFFNEKMPGLHVVAAGSRRCSCIRGDWRALEGWMTQEPGVHRYAAISRRLCNKSCLPGNQPFLRRNVEILLEKIPWWCIVHRFTKPWATRGHPEAGFF
jgi:hypothetical protein